VRNNYALLPGNLQEAFARLGPGLKAQGFSAYRAWWSRFSSVRITTLAVNSAAGTVTIRLNAVSAANGSVASDTERLILIRSADGTRLLINDDQLVSG
jgi:hypothetical protein